jgi:hypothetical protein
VKRLPYLIQRLRLRRRGVSLVKGIDAVFEFDYMGSSEFEWGSLPRSLKIMRDLRERDRTAIPPVEWKVEEIGVEVALTPSSTTDITAFFVGRADDKEMATSFLRDQLGDNGLGTRPGSTKERTEMREAFGVEGSSTSSVDGWWAVDAGWEAMHSKDTPLELFPVLPFVIFRKREHAELWLKEM